MLAMQLADAGRNVTLLEKEHGAHHKVCGEFLSREAVEYLHQARVAPSDLGAAPIHLVHLSSGRVVAEAALPFRALSLSRYVLDAALLARAQQRGCEVRRGVKVERLTAQRDAWLIELRGGESLSAQTVFLASGKHDLHGWARKGGEQTNLVGFKLHLQLAPAQTEALRDSMELFLFPCGYGGLSLVEGDVANLCLVVRRSRLRKLGGWTELLAAVLAENPRLRRFLQSATALWERPLAVSPIPYGYVALRPCGVWCVGVQAAVIPSFTGDGMSIALHSAVLAAQMYLAGKTADAYNCKLHTQLARGMRLATWLSRAMVTGPGRSLAPLGLALFPGVMGWIAASTRIPEEALLFPPEGPGPQPAVQATRSA
jgi:flavin-dependent dehydrogenase